MGKEPYNGGKYAPWKWFLSSNFTRWEENSILKM
jgi:hypothetical protein